MKKTFLPLIAVVLFSCSNKNVSSSVNQNSTSYNSTFVTSSENESTSSNLDTSSSLDVSESEETSSTTSIYYINEYFYGTFKGELEYGEINNSKNIEIKIESQSVIINNENVKVVPSFYDNMIELLYLEQTFYIYPNGEERPYNSIQFLNLDCTISSILSRI